MADMPITSKNHFHRAARALAETGELIAKEERYSVDLQKPAYLSSLKRHAEKLMRMMDAYKGER